MAQLEQVVGDEEKRREARWNLKRAMHDRRIADIERALLAAEECRLYPMELEHARHTLLEAQKADAVYKLEKTLSSGDIDAIRVAIEQAASAGVNASKIQSAEKILEDTKRQLDAKALLHEAMRANSIELLQQALQDATGLGMSENELSGVRRRLDVLERRAAALQRLRAAVRLGPAAELSAALGAAAAAGVAPAELRSAEEALEVEKVKAAARLVLKDARLGKKAHAAGRIADLHAALKEAKSAGLAAEELQGAREVLDELVAEASARRALKEAMESASIEELKPAIQKAQEAGIDEEELAVAKTQLENAYKPAARAKLKDAVQSRDIEAILLAIEQGKAAGLSVMAIAEAAEIVKEEELKIQLRRRMGELYGCTNVAELRAAIKLGQLHGLNQELDDARKQLGELEEQGAMCARVSKAIESGEILQIKEAVAAAEELSRRVLTPCIPTELLQEADAAMQHEIISAAQSMIQEAIKKCSGAAAIHRDGNPPEQESFNAKAVLQARRRSQANFEAALEAMGGESRPGSPPEPNPRQSGLGKRRTSALTQLGAAGAGEEYIQRIQMLKTAINGAEVLGLGESEIQPAREAMLEQTKKLQACQALAQGKKLKSLHHIQQALEMAHEAGLSHMEMKAALDAQKEIKKMDEAAGKLEKAVDLRDLEKLRWAIKWAKEAKVDEDDVADAQEVLQELEMRQKALNQLKCAQEAEDMEALAKALDEADCLDEEELEPYEQALRAGRHSRAQKALDEAMESRSIPALEEALSLAETAQFSGDLTGCHRVLAEEMIVQAMTSTVLALHRLRKAIEEATLWAPDFEPLAGALKRLKMEEQRERARESLQGALKSLDPSKLAQAIRAGRDCLEDWEMRGAEKALDRIRQEIMDDMYKSAIGPRSS